MNDTVSRNHEQRRASRKRVEVHHPVIDVIRDQPLGRPGDLSVNGMLLIGLLAPNLGAIYQVRLTLPEPDGHENAIEVGIQAQWCEPALQTGQVWAGYRIIAMAAPDAARLDHWLRRN